MKLRYRSTFVVCSPPASVVRLLPALSDGLMALKLLIVQLLLPRGRGTPSSGTRRRQASPRLPRHGIPLVSPPRLLVNRLAHTATLNTPLCPHYLGLVRCPALRCPRLVGCVLRVPVTSLARPWKVLLVRLLHRLANSLCSLLSHRVMCLLNVPLDPDCVTFRSSPLGNPAATSRTL